MVLTDTTLPGQITYEWIYRKKLLIRLIPNLIFLILENNKKSNAGIYTTWLCALW